MSTRDLKAGLAAIGLAIVVAATLSFAQCEVWRHFERLVLPASAMVPGTCL